MLPRRGGEVATDSWPRGRARARGRGKGLPAAVLCSGLLGAGAALAQPPAGEPAEPQPTAPPDTAAGESSDAEAGTQAKLEEAKRLFVQGNELRRVNDWERALEYYLKSRQRVASVPNTMNAAICLSELGRFDEALELYEELLTQFRTEITAEQRDQVAKAMETLRGQVGSVDVQANVKGSLVIDGRARGSLPLVTPVRVLPGKHVVRVLSDGYDGFETTIQSELGKTVTVQAKLAPLTSAGRVRMDDAELAGAEIFIDGALVGTAPWEGSLAPGQHLLFVRKGDEGSAPKLLTVVEGQTVLATAPIHPLGRDLRITIEPATAELLLDGVRVGKGRWQGRLPVGAVELEAREEGYRTDRRTLAVSKDMAGDVAIHLRVDESHPRWGVKESGHFFLDVHGGFALAPTYGSDVEASCDASGFGCSDDTLALGGLVGARGGYEWPLGISLQVGGGYLRTSKEITRTFTGKHTIPGTTEVPTYELTDALKISGPYAGAAVGYRLRFADRFELRADLMVGAWFAFSRDDVSGTLTGAGQSAPARVEGSGDNLTSPSLFVMPDVLVGMRFGGFGIGIGCFADIVVLNGPTSSVGAIAPEDTAGAGLPQVQADDTIAMREEALYRAHVLVVPSVTAGYEF